MSALNGIALRQATHLLTDGATYGSDGRVKEVGTKVLQLPAAHMAIGWAGYCRLAALERGLRKCMDDQEGILSALPGIVRKMVARNRWRDWGRSPEMRGLRLLIALWCDRAGEAQLWSLHSDNSILGPRYQPYSLVRLSRHFDIQPEDETLVLGLPIVRDWSTFDPKVQGLALLEHQRQEPWEDGRYCVGGFAQLTTVSADGVRATVLREWPDRVGEFIQPEVT